VLRATELISNILACMGWNQCIDGVGFLNLQFMKNVV